MEIYPSKDIATSCGEVLPGALVVAVAPESPADDAGFYPGCRITAVNGRVLEDILVWQWESAGDEITLSYIDGDGDAGEVELERYPDEPWGFTFDGVIYDGVRICKNACMFCFMAQLPKGMRPSLTLRDDDFRLSFLQGTFVTLTNMTDEDVERIITERISPLHVSLHATNAEVRKKLIGKHAARGLEVLDRLLAAGITCYAQIVLLPEVNDGEVLKETLDWAYERPGILEVGIVPLGYTDFQKRFEKSFQSVEASSAVLEVIEPFQQRALAERGHAWVRCADEFYCNAYGAQTPELLPDSAFYGDCSMYEDGIGIVRTFLDSWKRAKDSGAMDSCAQALRDAGAFAVPVFGESVAGFSEGLFADSPLVDVARPLFVHNAYFGGNVNVTGLLCGCDIVDALKAYEAPVGLRPCFYLPEIIFNDDGVTLDGMSLEDMEEALGMPLCVVSCIPEEFIPQIEDDVR